MRWEDERYVRVYTRDTAEWLALGWEAQALLVLLLRKADRAGIVQTGKAGARGLAALVGMPLDVAQRALPALLDDGCLREMAGGYVFPNFLAAQEARSSDAQRKREQRARDREKALASGATGSHAGLDVEAATQRATTVGMVYVVRASGKVKVGYTSVGIDARLRNYRTHAPDAEILAFGPGSQADERALHRLLGVTTRAGEWCHAAPDLLAHVLSCVTDGGVRVTPYGHATLDNVTPVTESVTPSRAVPCRAEPNRTVPNSPQPPKGQGDGEESRREEQEPPRQPPPLAPDEPLPFETGEEPRAGWTLPDAVAAVHLMATVTDDCPEGRAYAWDTMADERAATILLSLCAAEGIPIHRAPEEIARRFGRARVRATWRYEKASGKAVTLKELARRECWLANATPPMRDVEARNGLTGLVEKGREPVDPWEWVLERQQEAA